MARRRKKQGRQGARDAPPPPRFAEHPQHALSLTCASCAEFVPDADGPRGRCLHPASGIFAPWQDTPACPYHSRLR